jgi:acyl dehydratase
MPKLYYDNVEIGDPVTPLTKPPVTRVQIAQFAGASLDYSPLHIDDDFAKAAGYGGVFAHGNIALGFATEAVARWLENGRVVSTHAKFQRLVWPGDILTAKGVVVARHDDAGEPRIDVDVWAENQNHDIVMKGQITCVLFRDDKEEKKTKAPWPAPQPKTAAKLRAEREAVEAARSSDDEHETFDDKPAKANGGKKKAAPAAAPVKKAAPAPAPAAAPAKKAAEAAKKPAKKAPEPAKKAPEPAKKAPAAKKKPVSKSAGKAKKAAAAKKKPAVKKKKK